MLKPHLAINDVKQNKDPIEAKHRKEGKGSPSEAVVR